MLDMPEEFPHHLYVLLRAADRYRASFGYTSPSGGSGHKTPPKAKYCVHRARPVWTDLFQKGTSMSCSARQTAIAPPSGILFFFIITLEPIVE